MRAIQKRGGACCCGGRDFTRRRRSSSPELKSCLWGPDIENVSAISLPAVALHPPPPPLSLSARSLDPGRLINKVFLRVFKARPLATVNRRRSKYRRRVAIALLDSSSYRGDPPPILHYAR